MSKIGRIFQILFGDDIGVVPQNSTMSSDEIGFGPQDPGVEDKKLKFNKDAIMEELKVPPVKIEQGKITLKIFEVKRIIASLKKKKMDISIYQETLKQLENRKRFTPEIEEHLNLYPITTREKIEELSTKYKLVFRNLQGITRDIPLGAVKAIEEFCKPLEKNKISFDGSNFFLIASDDWWQKKRDPILVVKSPFGNYYHILYAWDKEVNIVSELFDDNDE